MKMSVIVIDKVLSEPWPPAIIISICVMSPKASALPVTIADVFTNKLCQCKQASKLVPFGSPGHVVCHVSQGAKVSQQMLQNWGAFSYSELLISEMAFCNLSNSFTLWRNPHKARFISFKEQRKNI